MTLILEDHECRTHCKTQEKAKTQWHGKYHELNCLPKPCVSHPMSSIMKAKNRQNVGSVSHPAGCFNRDVKLWVISAAYLVVQCGTASMEKHQTK